MAEPVAAVLKEAPHVQAITVPDLGVFVKEDPAPRYTYSKSWEEAKDDPWVVFHTSGTTGLSPMQPSFVSKTLTNR
jgi:acyl-coenzyme A synthetase/AMP-(fatty) acid ligase